MRQSKNIPQFNWQDSCIRLFDIVLSAIGLLFILPLVSLIAVLIWLDDRGPILFVQSRIGKDRQAFRIKKFRTMSIEKHRPTGELASEPGVSLKEQRAKFQTASPNDARITKIGRFLRPMHLDEIPQLLNVLTGEMSLVGVRPDVAVQQADYTPQQWIDRHVLRPGITGLAQVDPTVTSTETRTDRDLTWVRTRSIGLYVAILLRTIGKVVKRNSL